MPSAMQESTMTEFSFQAGAPLAYSVSRWAQFLYDQRAAVSPALQAAAGQIGSTVFDALRGDIADRTEREAAYAVAQGDGARFGAETFARLYNGPDAVQAGEPWAITAHKILDELPEWKSLRDDVEGDPDFSALATMELLPVVASKLPALLAKKPPTPPREHGQGGEGGGAGAGGDQDGDGEPTDDEADTDTDTDTDGRPVSEQLGEVGQQLRAALRRAVASAAEKVADAKEAMAGIAPGSETVPTTHAQKDPRRLQLAEALLKRKDFQEVIRMAGKLERLAQRKHAVRDEHARDEVVGIERGSDIARVLPSELGVLGDDDLDVLFYARFVEGSLQQYQLIGKEPQGKGPVVLLLDESGSMEGRNERWAKAAALACIAVGRKERRDVVVAFFQTRITAAWVLYKSGEVHTMSCTQPSEDTVAWGDAAKLAMELLTRKSTGGTIFDQPLSWAVDTVECTHPKADIVFVTDGAASATPATLARIEAARKEGLRIFGLTVSGGSISPAVQAVCTVTVDLDRAVDIEKELADAIPTRPD